MREFLSFFIDLTVVFIRPWFKGKYSLLVSGPERKPGPRGPSPELIQLIVEIKQKNPKYGCPRIAMLVSQLLRIKINVSLVQRIWRKHYYLVPGGQGPSWLTNIGVNKDQLWSIDFFRCESIVLKSHWVRLVMDQFSKHSVAVTVHKGSLSGESICQMFAHLISKNNIPKYQSSDNDPLFRYHQWQANLRILEISEIKSVSEISISHPFIIHLMAILMLQNTITLKSKKLICRIRAGKLSVMAYFQYLLLLKMEFDESQAPQ